MSESPYKPLIYIRGYAGTQSEVEDTVADPYMGFNVGSTLLRQRWTGDIDRHIFESPLIRLMKDHGYHDVYTNGAEPRVDVLVPPKSVWIFRYYEPVSNVLGSGHRPEMEDYAKALRTYLKVVRAHVCGDDAAAAQDFEVYLVAHSMGGLVARCYLQNIAPQDADAVRVDKVFTYATPHGGIDFRLIGNVPSFLRVNNIENFNVPRIREYLKLDASAPANSLDDKFSAKRFFCLVGTNSKDYRAAGGASSAAVGPLSDGLVQIRNAAIQGAPRAFVHRSHSGHHGIVNSEEGYQNLSRFLFGSLRVEGTLEVNSLSLPARIEKKRREGCTIRASYHIEVIGRVRRARWDLTRRLVAEESAIFRPYDRMVEDERPVHLFTAFLARWGTKPGGRSMGFSVDLGVLVPEYECDGFLLFDEHIEGGYLFRDKLNLTATPSKHSEPRLRYGWDKTSPNRATRTAVGQQHSEHIEFRIPVRQRTAPGIDAQMVLRVSDWS